MSNREQYIEKMKSKLDDLNSEISKLEAKARDKKASFKEDYDEEIKVLKGKREEAGEKLDELRSASDSAWEEVKRGLENAWNSVTNSVSSAKQKIKEKTE